ncbi:MAG: hypothetical protein JWQ27_1822 [Ferruginibacter sp.]|nr:hypothetical protein [Ferruginibacter sp.]
MKKTFKYFIALGLCGALLYSCKPDNDFTAGQPQNRMAQLAGAWKLQSVSQIDLIAKSNNFSDPSRPEVDLTTQDITAVAPFTDMTITFAEDATNAPTTFSVIYGNAPKIFKLSAGTWKVDNLTAPGSIKLINGVDTTTTLIGAVNNLSLGMMTLQLKKYQGVKAVTQYNYNFKKN